MPDFKFVVPRAVVGTNHGYHIVHVAGHCRIAKLEEVTAWQTEVAYRTKLARPKGWMPGRRVHIEYKVWFARAGRDADGIAKFLLDGIASGLGVNDSSFLFACTSNEVDKVNPRVEVSISNAE
jgi:Holliday junction resolvase RusA-like endonuclease